VKLLNTFFIAAFCRKIATSCQQLLLAHNAIGSYGVKVNR